MKTFKSFWTYIKPLVRSTVDSHVLPGVVTGSEICWLYLLEWKKELSTIFLAITAIMLSQVDLPSDSTSYSSHTVAESENVR